MALLLVLVLACIRINPLSDGDLRRSTGPLRATVGGAANENKRRGVQTSRWGWYNDWGDLAEEEEEEGLRGCCLGE